MSVSYEITKPTRANSFILLGIFWIIIELAILIVKMEPIFAWYDFLLIGAGYLFFGFAALNILNNFLYEKYKTSIISLLVNFALFLVVLVFISSLIAYVFLFLNAEQEKRKNVAPEQGCPKERPCFMQLSRSQGILLCAWINLLFSIVESALMCADLNRTSNIFTCWIIFPVATLGFGVWSFWYLKKIRQREIAGN